MRDAARRTRRGRGTRAASAALVIAALVIAALAAPGRGAAQPGHPLPDLGRALHERLAQADVVAFATVARVEVGRLYLRDVAPVLGEIDDGASVKRSPQAPPPFAEGDRGLFLLRGARPPYALVDQPAEMVAMSGADDEAAWRSGLDALLAARDRPDARLDLYLSWLDGASETRRHAARVAFFDAGSPLRPLPPRAMPSRVEAALDPERPAAARALSAVLAAETEAGLDALLARVAAEDAAADAEVTRTILQVGLARSHPAAHEALLRALRHADNEIRRVAARLAERLAPAPPEIAAELARMRRDEVDEAG